MSLRGLVHIILAGAGIVVALLLMRSQAFGQFGIVEAVVSGDTVTLWNRGLTANCASRFVWTVAVITDSVNVLETDTSRMLANCDCRFDNSVTIAGLPPGQYAAGVYRRHLLPVDTTFFVGSTEFVIGLSPPSQLLFSGWQSPCRGSASVQGENVPSAHILYQNYPNPFNPTTTIRYLIAGTTHVTLKVYDILGLEVVTLVDGVEQPGYKSVLWDARRVASGVYVCQLRAGSSWEAKKLVLIR